MISDKIVLFNLCPYIVIVILYFELGSAYYKLLDVKDYFRIIIEYTTWTFIFTRLRIICVKQSFLAEQSNSDAIVFLH